MGGKNKQLPDSGGGRKLWSGLSLKGGSNVRVCIDGPWGEDGSCKFYSSELYRREKERKRDGLVTNKAGKRGKRGGSGSFHGKEKKNELRTSILS